LPAVLIKLDKIIIKTTMGFKKNEEETIWKIKSKK
jgi:hypothetical protein